jgi:hypothetical protein
MQGSVDQAKHLRQKSWPEAANTIRHAAGWEGRVSKSAAEGLNIVVAGGEAPLFCGFEVCSGWSRGLLGETRSWFAILSIV